MESPKRHTRLSFLNKEVVAPFVKEALNKSDLGETLLSIIITPPEKSEDFYAIAVTTSYLGESSEMT